MPRTVPNTEHDAQPGLGDGCSNSCRENNCNTWLKLLDTRIRAVIVLPIYGFKSRRANRSRVLPPPLKTDNSV